MKLLRNSATLPTPRFARFEQYLKRRYVRPGVARLDRKRIFILPTYYGVVFGVTLFVMLLGALNYNNSLAFLLTFLLGGVALIATYHTYRNIHDLTLRPGRSAPTFVGQEAIFSVMVENYGHPARYAVGFRAQDQQPVVADLAENDASKINIHVAATKRGRMKLDIVTVETRFPLGVYRAWSYARVDAACIVYPQPAPAASRPLPAQHGEGEHAGYRHGTDDFVGFRDYSPGDSTRHIYWRAVARGQPLLTKQFTRPQAREMWLEWNETPGSDVEAKLSQLCRWILEAEQSGVRYGLRLPTLEIEPNHGELHKHSCLEALALYKS